MDSPPERMRCHRQGNVVVIDLGDTVYYLTPEEARQLMSNLGLDLEEERVDWRTEGF